VTVRRPHFAFRIDMWNASGENIVEHIAGVEDYQVAQATYRAAIERWQGGVITLRQGERVITGQSAEQIRRLGRQGAAGRAVTVDQPDR
jgi:hypothetical protein